MQANVGEVGEVEVDKVGDLVKPLAYRIEHTALEAQIADMSCVASAVTQTAMTMEETKKQAALTLRPCCGRLV